MDDLFAPQPEPAEVRALRDELGLTQAQAAREAGLEAAGQVRWAEYEKGTRRIDAARWTLFLLAVKRHPIFELRRRAGRS
jgi:hypothetical protein